jgi:divalent metal cation (Fe/Co/Zn/Cd) transporter
MGSLSKTLLQFDQFPQTLQFKFGHDGLRSVWGLFVSLFVVLISLFYTASRGAALVHRLDS